MAWQFKFLGRKNSKLTKNFGIITCIFSIGFCNAYSIWNHFIEPNKVNGSKFFRRLYLITKSMTIFLLFFCLWIILTYFILVGCVLIQEHRKSVKYRIGSLKTGLKKRVSFKLLSLIIFTSMEKSQFDNQNAQYVNECKL